jgi:hypothetical protein
MRNININDTVKVKLTEHGVNFVNRYEENRYLLKKGSNEMKTELWHLMQIFGDAMYMGGDQFFINNTITLLDD